MPPSGIGFALKKEMSDRLERLQAGGGY